MNKIKYIIILIFLGSALFSQVATPFNSLHERYWYYRTRLNNDFLMVGLDAGKSIPMGERNFGASGCDGGTVNGNAPRALFGDELTLMGPYIGVLATEHYLLKKNHQSTDKVDFELFCALNALNRLDFTAESAFLGQNHLDGFMLKDDIDVDFLVNNYQHFNFINSGTNSQGLPIDANGNLVHGFSILNPVNIASDGGFCESSGPIWQLQGATFTGSDLISHQVYPTNVNNAAGCVINLDSYVSLLYGLRLVTKFVENTASSNNQPFPIENANVTSLVQEAMNIGGRIQHYFESQNWNLSNPVTNLPTNAGSGHGGSAYVFSYPFSEAYCHLKGFNDGTDGDVEVPGQFNEPFSCSNSDPSIHGNLLAYTPLWNDSHTSHQFTPDNAEFNMDLLASCDCGWDGALQAEQTVVCDFITSNLCGEFLSYVPFVPNADALCTDITSFVCSAITQYNPIKQNYSYEDMHYNIDRGFYHSPLLYEALNGLPATSNSISLRGQWIVAAQNVVASAPCEGPHHYNSGCNGGVYFSSVDLVNHPEEAPANGGSSAFNGNFPGIDYLLYYNLLKIVSPGGITNGLFFDLSDRTISGTVGCPTGAPCTIGAFETIDFKNDVNNNPVLVTPSSNITFRAGKSTNGGGVAPGGFTSVHFGGPPSSWTGSINIKIDRFTCGSSGEYQRTNNSSGDYGELGSTTPTHFIQYENKSSPIVSSINSNNNLNSKPNTTNNSPQLINKIDKVTVFPNPNDGSFNLKVQLSSTESVTYEITDVLGRSILKENDVKSDEVILNRSIDLSGEKKGVYYIKLITSKGFVNVKSIIIQ